MIELVRTGKQRVQGCSVGLSKSIPFHHKNPTVAGTDDESEDGETETPRGRPYRSGSGSWHRQLSPCSVLSAASSGRLYAEPAQTLIFLDWDDTIFPCTEIFQKRNYSRKTREWTQCLGGRRVKSLLKGPLEKVRNVAKSMFCISSFVCGRVIVEANRQ